MSASTSTASASLSPSRMSDKLYINLPKCWDTLCEEEKEDMVWWLEIIDAEAAERTLPPGQTLRIGSDKTKCGYPLKINDLSGVYFELAVTNEDITFKNIMLPSVKVEGVKVDVDRQEQFSEGFHIIITGCATKFVVHKLQPTTVMDNSNDKKYKKLVDKKYIMTEKKLGEGTYGSVYLGMNRATPLQEVSMLRGLRGRPHFIQLAASHTTFRGMYVILQHAWGDLDRYIRLHGMIPEACAKKIFKQLLKGIKIMHDNDMVHRDIKPGNILLLEFSQSPTAVYADFGLTEKLVPPTSFITKLGGTKPYMAPEVFTAHNLEWRVIKAELNLMDKDLKPFLKLSSLMNDGYGKASDMWSLGITLFQMLFGRLPFQTSSEYYKSFRNTLKMDVAALNRHGRVTDEGMELICNLLKVDASKRYTADDALACSWLAELAAEEASSSASLQQSRKRNRHMPSTLTRTNYPRDAKRVNINYKCNAYEVFSFNKVIQELNRFTNSQLSAFYVESIKERLYADDKLSLTRRSAQTAVYHDGRWHNTALEQDWIVLRHLRSQYYQLVGKTRQVKGIKTSAQIDLTLELEDSAIYPLGQLLQKYVY
ncbi:kinase-like domain-containing protein [Syncephalis plumigaleata]|nr:kinase-like domain-containing protein [Syncephalis plumigaleata]